MNTGRFYCTEVYCVCFYYAIIIIGYSCVCFKKRIRAQCE